MSDFRTPLPLSMERRIDEACDRFEEEWLAGREPCLEDYLDIHREPERSLLLRGLLVLDLDFRLRHGQRPVADKYHCRFPDHGELIDVVFRQANDAGKSEKTFGTETRAALDSNRPVSSDHRAVSEKQRIGHIGRYRVIRQLGQGGFGRVYLARDDELQRDVAVKVPRRERMSGPREVDNYLTEARSLASLDHSSIVPVYDFGRTDDGSCFVVSKFIEGSDLEILMQSERLAPGRIATIIATVADALHHAHGRGIIHRDVKPANILIDTSGIAHVVDFGLALKDEQFGQHAGMVGTPTYMSPEQARGEGHLVDGRSDVFSLGVVLYQALTGQVPFHGSSWREVAEQVKTVVVRPPRQLDDSIPAELERICLKALSKRAVDRYRSAHELAEDLWHLGLLDVPPDVRHDTARVVPKGLRPFDDSDSEFFFDLIPGPRWRDGLPESIHFWRTHLEELVPEKTFRVGLIYGPSGCGKSSLVRAGLLPKLREHVLPVYVEATATNTEESLLVGLRRALNLDPHHDDLREVLSQLRRGQLGESGQKVVLMLDQFEQYLHGRTFTQPTGLVEALRHCDGARVQCVVMVRDDFWMAATRFMRELEIPLREGHNSAAVDLFDILHARQVLTKFGQAYGRLPDEIEKVTGQQHQFVRRAVQSLATDDRVICVRLALFAEMVKDKEWIPATLQNVGGAHGVGVTYLEETFESKKTPPENRLHCDGARRVLESLLPTAGSDIKGNRKSRAELMQVARYSDRAREFDELMKILDGETRLLTPIENDENGQPEATDQQSHVQQRYYQLTHDYLVPSLRQWLLRNKSKTWRGRAELRLAEQSSIWNERPVNRNLPGWWEFLCLALLTRGKDRDPAERRMMRNAARMFSLLLSVMVVVVSTGTWLGVTWFRGIRVDGLVDSLTTADISEVNGIAARLSGYGQRAETTLRTRFRHTPLASVERLHIYLAMAPFQKLRFTELRPWLLEGTVEQFEVLLQLLSDHEQVVHEDLWRVLEDEAESRSRRFRAACALAYSERVDLGPPSARWQKHFPLIVDEQIRLCNEDRKSYPIWIRLLRPLRGGLRQLLEQRFLDHESLESRRTAATSILADFFSDSADVLTELILDADPDQFAILMPKLKSHRVVARKTLERQFEILTGKSHNGDMVHQRRLASNAMALVELGAVDSVWGRLGGDSSPGTRSALVHAFAQYQIDPNLLAERFAVEKDAVARRCMMLSIGEFPPHELGSMVVQRIRSEVEAIFQSAPNLADRAAARWLLSRWVTDTLFEDPRVDPSHSSAVVPSPQDERNWYVTPGGQTMAVLGPDSFQMGARPNDRTKEPAERLHTRIINRRFAIAQTETTVEQWERFDLDEQFDTRWSQRFESDRRGNVRTQPKISVTWHEAAQFCNWLSKISDFDPSQWCYDVVPDDQIDGPASANSTTRKYRRRMIPRADHVRLTGYRLPTEAEWEYACRAGTDEIRYFGRSNRLLGKYIWYRATSTGQVRGVALLKPNEFGLFDMLGNAWEWCNSGPTPYPAAGDATEDTGEFPSTEERVLRGGSFAVEPQLTRSAVRYTEAAELRNLTFGFRVARTICHATAKSALRSAGTTPSVGERMPSLDEAVRTD